MKNSAAIVASTLVSLSAATAAESDKVLYKDLVAPILEAKCVSCHGEEKSKGKLRLDNFEHIMKGGSEGDTVLPGKASDSGLIFRVILPLDDDEHMPPEDKPQLTEAEFDALTFWIKSGAKADAKIGDLKPDEKERVALATAFKDVAQHSIAHAADPAKEAPVELTESEKQAIAETVSAVAASGASLMPIAQDTPALRFTALNVQKEFDDKGLDLLKPASGQIQWADLARTQITDAGLKTVGSMSSLTRLHLDGTGITDAGLDHLKGLEKLQYLNLYGTKVTDAGLEKLAGLKSLEKVFVWQTGVTDAGAQKLSAALPNVSVNTGWSAASAAVAVAVPAKPEPKSEPKPAPKPEPKPEPKPTPKPTPKPAPKPAPVAPVPAPTAKPAPTPPAPTKPLAGSIEESITTAKKVLADAKTKAATARTAATEAVKKAEAAQKTAESADSESKKAAEALDLLEKAAAALK